MAFIHYMASTMVHGRRSARDYHQPADIPMPGQDSNWRTVFPQLAESRDPWLATLLDQSSPAEIPAGTLVFRHGFPCPGFALLLSGAISVTMLTEKGREVALYRVLPGETCMLTVSCLMSGEPYPAEGMTDGETTALMLDSDQYQEALDRSPEFRRFVLGGLGHRLAGLMHRIDEVAYGDIDGLLASALLQAAADSECVQVTHRALAVEIGTAREVVSRHLKRFENNGWIRMQRGSIELIDSDALSQLAPGAR